MLLVAAWTALTLQLPQSPGPSTTVEEPAPMTVREAQRLFRQPRGSVSMGRTNGGSLIAGAAMPLSGPGFKVFPSFVPRETNWGTSELIGLLKRVAKSVRKAHPRSVLGIGNISKKEGGQTGYSVSHKSGRDADVAMFALDRRGRPVNLMSFIKFQKDGWDKRRRYRFDANRNLTLVLALLNDPRVQVQYIFVARWLTEMMLEEATRRGVDAETRRRLEQVLWMPSDSNPHHDHFHIRVYCSVEDRLQGCLERGPIRDWVDLGDEEHEAFGQRLLAVTRMKRSALRVKALRRLGDIQATQVAMGLLPLLQHDDPKTRKVALTTLVRLGQTNVIAGLQVELNRTSDRSWAIDVTRAIATISGASATTFARTLLSEPQRVLHPKMAMDVPNRITERAVAVLARFGRKSAFQPLLNAFGRAPQPIKRRIHQALLRVTNQPNMPRARSPRKLRAAEARWRAFAAEHGAKDWLAWQRLGFVARGITLSDPLGKEAIEPLIGAIAHKDAIVSDNAVWVLGALTGNRQDPAWRSKRNNGRHWRSWWRDHAATLPEKLPVSTAP